MGRCNAEFFYTSGALAVSVPLDILRHMRIKRDIEEIWQARPSGMALRRGLICGLS